MKECAFLQCFVFLVIITILTILTMGGGRKELRRAYNNGEGMLRPMPPVDDQAVHEISRPAKF